MLSVQTNILAWEAGRQLGINTRKNAKKTEKLSSGYRINRAADDAAGLAISEKMRRQIRGLRQGAENIQDGIGYVQTADGALNEVHDMLQRMDELAVQAANGTNAREDREYIDKEVQELKKEMKRIFEVTTFNEKRIWEPEQKKLLGYEKRQAVEFRSTSTSIDVTNDNCGIVAVGDYKIHADSDGVYIDWTGYDGNPYKTETIDWDTLEKNNYSFEMSDYFGAADGNNKLYDANGNPVFKHQVSFAPQETATVDDIIKCIDGKYFFGSSYADMEVQFEDISGGRVSKNNVSFSSAYLNYTAAFASNHNTGKDTSQSKNIFDFDNADDKFLEPVDASNTLIQAQGSGSNLTASPQKTGSVDQAKDSDETWTFSFYMNGIGEVKAVSDRVSYYAPSDTEDDDETYWWHWQRYYEYGIEKRYKSYITIISGEKGNGTLGSVMAALTGEKGTNTPGLLTKANGGDCDNGGYINLRFTLNSSEQYTYGDKQTSNAVGSFTICFRVNPDDTEQTVLDRIKDTLNNNTIIDLYTPSGSSYYGSASFGTAAATRYEIDVPVYGGLCSFFVQAGAEAGQHIDVEYESLNIIGMGLQNTNVLTAADSRRAIDEIKEGMRIISEQRATFGAYQNRLEHAYNINLNVVENTQAAESVIRDTDMAKMMVEYANNNILIQAGTSMLAQANQQMNNILQLLK